MKGISPLVSAVLLLAVTMSVVTLFAGWAPNLIGTVTDQTANQTQAQVDCNDAALEVVSAKFYSSNNTTVVARNTGRIDLDSVRLEVWKNDIPTNSTTTSIEQGAYARENVTSYEAPSQVRAISTSCSNAKDSSDDIE